MYFADPDCPDRPENYFLEHVLITGLSAGGASAAVGLASAASGCVSGAG
uniref:PNPLA domain-containing protein n=1 Tax=Macrostomum lignano TaxID=282301 RepID=A0A1I8F4S4_9PLAT